MLIKRILQQQLIIKTNVLQNVELRQMIFILSQINNICFKFKIIQRPNKIRKQITTYKIIKL